MEIDQDFKYLETTNLENLSRNEANYIEIAKEAAKDVISKKISLLEIMERLECLLLNSAFSKRDMGVLLLSEILKNLGNAIDRRELSVLATYFCEKLKDHHQVATTALQGVFALIKLPDIPSESVIQLISTMFNHITCQQQQQQDRYFIYQIYETVLKNHSKDVDSMGADFVYGVISSIDGERDPKNLIYLFNWLETFLNTVKLGHLTYEMFDVLSCYFPVDYKAPPSDQNKISREELSEGLCKCLTAIPEFGEHGIPLALEKLDSDLKIAKDDSLDILKLGCKNYTTEQYYEHSIEIWSEIQKIVFNLSASDLTSKCLETLRNVIFKLSQGDSNKFDKLILDIVDTLKGNMLPDSRLFAQSSEILLHVAKGSQISSVHVLKKIGPLLENTYKISSSPKQKASILRTYVQFVRSAMDLSPNTDLHGIEEVNACCALSLQAITDQNIDVTIEGYKAFTEISPIIDKESLQTYLHILHEAIIMPLPTNLKEAVTNAFDKTAELYSQEVNENVLYKQIFADVIATSNYLESISNIVRLPYFEDYVLNTFMSYIVQDIEHSNVALKCLDEMLFKFSHVAQSLVERGFVTTFLVFLETIDNSQHLQRPFLMSINSVLINILRAQNTSLQKDIYLSEINRNFANQSIFVTVLSGLIVPLQKGVFQDYAKIDFLLHHYQGATDEFVRTTLIHTLANILNKIENEQVLLEKLGNIQLVSNSSKVSQDSKTQLISCITRSLVTRNHNMAWEWATMLINLLDNNVTTPIGFKLVTSENSSFISKENYCQIMPLYKQKFVIFCMNKLREIPEPSETHLDAIGYLIEYAPQLAVIECFKKAFKLIALCLETSKNVQVLEIILQKITEFTLSSDSVIEGNLEDIISRVLGLTTFEGSMSVRLAAIRCLTEITLAYKVYKLLPFKHKVIQLLGICVDDRKRLVRKEAMECRSLWYLLDAPL